MTGPESWLKCYSYICAAVWCNQGGLHTVPESQLDWLLFNCLHLWNIFGGIVFHINSPSCIEPVAMTQRSLVLQKRTCWSDCRATRCLALPRLQMAAAPIIMIRTRPHKCAQWTSEQHKVAATRDDVQPVPDLMIPESDLECDRRWISDMITTWLDEEWLPQEVHKDLGQAAGDAYVKCRQEGVDDMSSLVLGVSNELLSFNYRETFVNAFEVGNKVVEMLMMRSGVDVCCTSDEDAARIKRMVSQSESSKQQ